MDPGKAGAGLSSAPSQTEAMAGLERGPRLAQTCTLYTECTTVQCQCRGSRRTEKRAERSAGDTETTPGIIERLCNQVSSPVNIAAFHHLDRGQTPLWGQGSDLIMTLILSNCPDVRTLFLDKPDRYPVSQLIIQIITPWSDPGQWSSLSLSHRMSHVRCQAGPVAQ